MAKKKDKNYERPIDTKVQAKVVIEEAVKQIQGGYNSDN
jgi:hypothetical protein